MQLKDLVTIGMLAGAASRLAPVSEVNHCRCIGPPDVQHASDGLLLSAGLHYYQSGQGELLLCLYLRRLLNLLLHAASAGPAGHAASNSTGLGYPGGISSCCWTEAHATLLKSLVDTCSQVVSMQLDQVIVALKVAAQQPALSKGTAFGQMLMALVKQYAAVLTAQQISGLQAAASATNTFLTRSLVNKLQQLAQQQ